MGTPVVLWGLPTKNVLWGLKTLNQGYLSPRGKAKSLAGLQKVPSVLNLYFRPGIGSMWIQTN